MTEHLNESEWRTNVEEVKAGSFETDLDDEEIKEHIDDAWLEVEEKLTGTGMSDARLRKIERDLARHSIKFNVEREVVSERIGPMQFEYAGAFDEVGLEATSWGQEVLRRDTSNTLGSQDTRSRGGSFEVF